jgi:hypothetical protein
LTPRKRLVIVYFTTFLDIAQFKSSRLKAVPPGVIGRLPASVTEAGMWEAVSLSGEADQRVSGFT